MSNFGTPIGNQVSGTLSGSGITNIPNGSYQYIVLQVETDGGTFSDTTKICRYRVDGGTVSSSAGFLLGDGDVVIFQKGELKEGVNITSAEGGVDGKYTYQAYDGIPR